MARSLTGASTPGLRSGRAVPPLMWVEAIALSPTGRRTPLSLISCGYGFSKSFGKFLDDGRKAPYVRFLNDESLSDSV